MGRAFYTIVDGPLACFDTTLELRRVAREGGRRVAIVYADRPLIEAVKEMLGRALP